MQTGCVFDTYAGASDQIEHFDHKLANNLYDGGSDGEMIDWEFLFCCLKCLK